MNREAIIKSIFEVNNRYPYARKAISDELSKTGDAWPRDLFVRMGCPSMLIAAAEVTLEGLEEALQWLNEKMKAIGGEPAEPPRFQDFLMELSIKYPIAMLMLGRASKEIRSTDPYAILTHLKVPFMQRRSVEENKQELERAFQVIEERYKAYHN